MRRLVAALALAVTVALVPAGASAATNVESARRGATWLARQANLAPGQQADLIVDLAALGAPRAGVQRRFRSLVPAADAYARTAGAAGKVVLAAVAAGGDPQRVGGVNYVARIRGQYAQGRYGASTYDQAYAMLALRAARQPVPAAAITALRRTRGTGGWGYSMGARVRDDVSATALAIEALRASGVAARDPMLVGATAWLLSQRNREGGYAISGRSGPTEANSTALAIRALRVMGRRPAASTVAQLRSLQESDGGFRFTSSIRESRVLATADAVLALSGRALPPPY